MRILTLALAILGVSLGGMALYQQSIDSKIRTCDDSSLRNRIEELAKEVRSPGRFTEADWAEFSESLREGPFFCIRHGYGTE
jgi:hypothetical protein